MLNQPTWPSINAFYPQKVLVSQKMDTQSSYWNQILDLQRGIENYMTYHKVNRIKIRRQINAKIAKKIERNFRF